MAHSGYAGTELIRPSNLVVWCRARLWWEVQLLRSALKNNALDAVAVLLLGALLTWFVWLNVLVTLNVGLSFADDGFFALVSRNLAEGKVYGAPISSAEIQPFSAMVSTGPAAILPMAVLIRLFGHSDWLPGLATFLMFLAQITGFGLVLSRKFGWRPVVVYLAAFLLLLVILAARATWLFSFFLGECPALGWLLLGTSLLLLESRWALVGAGSCFALAGLTKQLPLLAIPGIVSIWTAVTWARLGAMRAAPGFALLASTIGLPLVLWETVRLIALGWPGYLDVIRETQLQATAPAALSVRISGFIGALSVYLSPIAAAGCLALAAIGFLIQRRNAAVASLATFLWGGAACYLVFVLLVPPLWVRYFWVGIMLCCAAVCAPLLVLQPRARLTVLIGMMAVVFAAGWHEPILAWQKRVLDYRGSEARAAVVRFLDATDMPIAAQTWSSLYDILALRQVEGEWVQERDIARFRNRDFLAVINDQLTAKTGEDGRFYRAVSSGCSSIMQEGRLSVYQCGKEFWPYYEARSL